MMFMDVEVEGEGERGGIGATPLALGLHPRPAQCAQLLADCGLESGSLDFKNVYKPNAEALRIFHTISPSPNPR
jgi:hypothetical protein